MTIEEVFLTPTNSIKFVKSNNLGFESLLPKLPKALLQTIGYFEKVKSYIIFFHKDLNLSLVL